MEKFKNIQIEIDCKKNGKVILNLCAETGYIHVVEDYEQNYEEKYQIEEGKEYEYEFKECGYYLNCNFSRILYPSNLCTENKPIRGKIKPGIYVGHIEFDVFKNGIEEKIGTIAFEIQSTKINYRKDYQNMMTFITECYTDLVMQQGSPVTQTFDIDPENDSQSQYQKFSFIKSVIESEEFYDAINKIQANPIRRWTNSIEERNIVNVHRFSRNNIRQLITGKHRVKVNSRQYNIPKELDSLPIKLLVTSNKDTFDTTENRFIKYALHNFLMFCTKLQSYDNCSTYLKKEANHVSNLLTHYLSINLFKDVKMPTILLLNSPALQRKEGYREVLQAWLMFDLSAILKWKGGENIYKAGKRNVALLYEYWLFFKLKNIIEKVFKLKSTNIEDLIEKTDNNINLKLTRGRQLMFGGKCNEGTRTLNINFYYNRTFERNDDIHVASSWSSQMRPDYTLSIWPGDNISEEEAEYDDLIVHIHFDAKYKLDKFLTQVDDLGNKTDELLEEKEEQEKGIYKRADLLKMHAYKDAIRRTSGAYILYPGTEQNNIYHGFHEIIPGIGAFCMRPNSEKTDIDEKELEKFIISVKNHLIDRSTLRERLTTHTHFLVQEKLADHTTLCAKIPESNKKNRNFIPDETFVLLGYCKNHDQYNWVIDNQCYNYHSRNHKGIFMIDAKIAQAEYILLHDGIKSYKLCKLNKTSNRIHILSYKNLINMGYPPDNRKHDDNDIYILFNFSTSQTEEEYYDMTWNMKCLLKYKGISCKDIGLIKLTELLNSRVI